MLHVGDRIGKRERQKKREEGGIGRPGERRTFGVQLWIKQQCVRLSLSEPYKLFVKYARATHIQTPGDNKQMTFDIQGRHPNNDLKVPAFKKRRASGRETLL